MEGSLASMKSNAEHLDRLQADTAATAVTSEHDDDLVIVRPDAAPCPFDAIYDTYAPLLRKIAVAKFGISTDDASDLVHDVFATYLVNPARVTELRPYLIGAVCNASRSYLRRMSTKDAVCSGLDVCMAANDERLEEAVVRYVLVGRILGRLGPSCRDVLYRFYFHGETAAVIAERRDTSAGYIGRLLHLCRKRARDAYHAMEKGNS